MKFTLFKTALSFYHNSSSNIITLCHYLVKNINISQHANETFYTGETLYHILMSNIFFYETKLLVSAL